MRMNEIIGLFLYLIGNFKITGLLMLTVYSYWYFHNLVAEIESDHLRKIIKNAKKCKWRDLKCTPTEA